MRLDRIVVLLVVLAVASVGLAGCGDPTVAPSVSMSPSMSASDTPSPSPTPVMPAGYDPSWTENQLAAVRVVDAYELLMYDYKARRVETVLTDGELEADTSRLENLVAEPALGIAIGEINAFLNDGLRAGGWSAMIDHAPGAEKMAAGGHRQITVLGCVDTSNISLFGSSGQEVHVNRPFLHLRYTYTVQRVDETGDWLIVLVRGGGTEC